MEFWFYELLKFFTDACIAFEDMIMRFEENMAVEVLLQAEEDDDLESAEFNNYDDFIYCDSDSDEENDSA